ncbi:MAG TPA: 4Fe-4S binding protein [Candidatus Omnitrophota bacterium]|mgnify:CR=1 FL=1|nr:4Fe-4S binding protein [Candidatus Omnitrophota bacterium]HPT07878.1 4Fe-4S binding protein [Candidatus Omnitrophota bacterium]
MKTRTIIHIDEEKCNGCGECVPNCPEGAIQIIDKKARLVSDLFCDGLGACLGRCPQQAITIEERPAEAYEEKKVMANIVKAGPNTIQAHLKHLKEHNETTYLSQALEYLRENNIALPQMGGACPSGGGHMGGCPGSRVMQMDRKDDRRSQKKSSNVQLDSALTTWPVQLMLVPAYAPYLNNADVLISADCVPFAYANFHQDVLKDKVLLVACPKLDDLNAYRQKLAQIFEHNTLRSLTYAHMEVPCCFGLIGIIREVIAESGKKVPFHEVIVSIKGEIIR